MASKQEKDKAVNVQVLLRCRPFHDDELRSNAPQVVTCNEFQREVSVSQTIAGKQIDRVFTFDKVFGPSAKQRDLYEQAVVPIVNEVLEGFNCTIFAYGQTGTGKTYTMEGECRKSKCGPNRQLPQGAGVIPRAIKQIFDTLESQNTEYSVKVTFIELYNEEITDLLAPEELSKVALDEKQKKALPLMEDGKGGVLVRGIEEEIVTSANEIFSLLERGSAKRRTAETLLNKQSSRSHSLFSITIHIKEATPEGEELIKCGKLNLVDLAGSENISRSGAREGRAREAGEINKSLLTLGRVITALVEHLGHVPYRDSKLTRLLRDSLGGRTKTCIIATVSPSVHCLEETLSTLDYAHRAKNIKNRPEVNQKMMKLTLIKDLYGEIERLKADLSAHREKDGVYIPKDRYYQELSERKAMGEEIEQNEIQLDTKQKQIDSLQEKYEAQLQQSVELGRKLDATEKSLEETSKLLAATKEDLKQAQYNLKEKNFVISEQRKAESALTHRACQLRTDLEKSICDNASLFSKIARKDELNMANRSLVNKFQAELVQKIDELSNLIAVSSNQQNKHLELVEKLCSSCVDFSDKTVRDLKKKVSAAQALHISHIEGVQNIVRLHKASANGSLEDMFSSILLNAGCLDQLLAVGEGEAELVFDDLQKTILNYRREIADFSCDLRKRFNTSLDHAKNMSAFIVGVLDKLKGDTEKLETHICMTHEAHANSIADFQKVFEEQSRLEADKLLADISSLVFGHMKRQKDLVEVRLTGLREGSLENKAFWDEYTSTTQSMATGATTKWDEFYTKAENASVDGADFASAKHCRMELILQECANMADYASQHFKKTQKLTSKMNTKHITEIETLVRSAIETNEQHDTEVAEARNAAEEDVSATSKDILQQLDSHLDHGKDSSSTIRAEVKAHSATLQHLGDGHGSLAEEIKIGSENVFCNNYADYEPTGDTPVRSEPDIPSKGKIESLRAMPVEALVEEFRENQPYESTKEPRPTLIPRSPLIQINRISSPLSLSQ